MTRTNAALNSGFDWSDPERDALRLLWVDRQRAYDDLRQRHEVPITRTLGDELVSQIVSFAERASRDPNLLVTYFTSDEPSASPGVMAVSRALATARLKLVRIWREKLGEYITASDTRLQEHLPREAMAELRRWEELPGLHDERLGVAFPQNLSVRVGKQEAAIRPKLEAYETGEAALLRARLEIQTDVVTAFRSWQAAQAAFPQLPDLQALLVELKQKARGRLRWWPPRWKARCGRKSLASPRPGWGAWTRF